MMINKEDRFIDGEKLKANPFKVPEGYFDTFASGLMDRLPERETVEVTLRPRLHHRMLRRVLYAAACLCLAVCGAAVYWSNSPQGGAASPDTSGSQAATADSYVDQVADYTMMDNSDIYGYLSSNDQ